MVIQRLSKNVADGMCQDIRSEDATSQAKADFFLGETCCAFVAPKFAATSLWHRNCQVFREAFAACDQGSHGYLTWSEVTRNRHVR